MVASFGGGDDVVRLFGPAKGTQVYVGFRDKAVDGGLKRDQGVEHATLEPSFGQLCGKALDGVEPRCGVRGEVEGEAGMPP